MVADRPATLSKQSSALASLLDHVAHIGGIAAISHLGANALYGGVRALSHWSPKNRALARLVAPVRHAIHGYEARSFSRGARKALEGAPRGAGQRLVETLAGPESYAASEHGRLLGEALRKIPKEQRSTYLTNLRSSLSKLQGVNPSISRTPVLSNLGKGIDDMLARGLPEMGAVRPESAVTKATPYLVTAGAGLLDPPAAVHGVLNIVRVRAPKTTRGLKFLENEAREGAARSLPGWESPATAKARWLATDTFLSPMARDPGRLAETLGRSARANPAETISFLDALGRTPGANALMPHIPKLKQRTVETLKARSPKSPGEAARLAKTLRLKIQGGGGGAFKQRALEKAERMLRSQIGTVPGYEGWKNTQLARFNG